MMDVTFECPCCGTLIDVTLMHENDRVEYKCQECYRRAYYSLNPRVSNVQTGITVVGAK